MLNLSELVVFNGQVLVVANDRGVVVFNQTIEVFLRMQVDLLFARLVFKTELVKPSPWCVSVRSTVLVLCSGKVYGGVLVA